MKATEIKALSGKKNLIAGIDVLCKRIEAKEWKREGRVYRFAGYDRRKDTVHFTCTWSVPGGAAHRRVGITMHQALDSTDGDLGRAWVLC